MPNKAQAKADAVAAVIADGDLLAKQLGVTLEAVGPGFSRCSMVVRPDMANAASVGHGGATFSLADTAFAYACNSHNRTALATNCSISFLAAVQIGDRLTAEAREIALNGRSGVCDVTVTDQTGRCVALFRGHSRQIAGHLAPHLEAEPTLQKEA